MAEVPVRISLTPDGRGSVLVAEQDISSAVTALSVESRAGGRVRLTLELPLLEVEGERARVGFTPAVHEALVAMGWTPPAGDA